jgi:hypothetical protein
MRTVDHSTQLLIDIIVAEILTCELCKCRLALSPARHIPKSLDCSHTFCLGCLERLKTGMGMFSSIICPTCSVETTVGITGMTGLKNNQTVIAVINILEAFNAVTCHICHVKPATLECRSCRDNAYLCESCHQDSPHSDHDVQEIRVKSPGPTQRKTITSPFLVKSKDDDVVSIVSCPRNIVGRVISSPSVSFDEIRAETCCNIEVRRLSERESPAEITIRGPRQSVLIAQNMVMNIISSVRGMQSDSPANDTAAEITIDISQYEAIDLFELRYYINTAEKQPFTILIKFLSLSLLFF